MIVYEPSSIEEAVVARVRHRPSRYLSGGTDLFPNVKRGLNDCSVLIDVRKIAELRRLELSRRGLTIGAAVTLAELTRVGGIRERYPALVAAAESVGAPAHREAATVGGNLCLDTRCAYYNESTWWRESNGCCLKYRGDTCHIAPGGTRCWAAYSGDLAPALLVYDAEVEIAGPRERFRLPLGGLFKDDGASSLTLGEGELVTAIHLPPDPWPAAYAKARHRGAIDFPLVGIAYARSGRHVRVGLTGTDSRPTLLEASNDDAEIDRLCAMVQERISPMRTTLATPTYRRRVATTLLKRLASTTAR